MKYVPLNLALMKNPVNWISITAMALIGALFLDILTKGKSNG